MALFRRALIAALALLSCFQGRVLAASLPSLFVVKSDAGRLLAGGISPDTLVKMAEIAWNVYKSVRGERPTPAIAPVQGTTPPVLFFTYPVSTVVATSQWVPVAPGIMAATNNYGDWAYYYASNGQLYGFSALNRFTGRLDTYYANGWRVASELTR